MPEMVFGDPQRIAVIVTHASMLPGDSVGLSEVAVSLVGDGWSLRGESQSVGAIAGCLEDFCLAGPMRHWGAFLGKSSFEQVLAHVLSGSYGPLADDQIERWKVGSAMLQYNLGYCFSESLDADGAAGVRSEKDECLIWTRAGKTFQSTVSAVEFDAAVKGFCRWVRTLGWTRS